VRNYYAYKQGKIADTCRVFSAPIVETCQLPYSFFTEENGPADLVAVYREAQAENRAGAILLAEGAG